MTRHSREDALTDREFELLLEGAMELPEPQATEARLIILLGGRLGLRPGETAHLRAEWVDLESGMIQIPQHDPCDFGRNGGVCGYCRQQAAKELETHNHELDEVVEAIEAELVYGDDETELFEAVVSFVADDRDASTLRALDTVREQCLDGEAFDRDRATELAAEFLEDHNLELEAMLEDRWHPKTPNSARRIPFDFDTRTEIAIRRFVERYDQFPKSRPTVNRRVTQACAAAEEEIEVYPHALRATSATHHAARGVSVYALQNMMGWKKISTAEKYIRSSGEATAAELRSPK